MSKEISDEIEALTKKRFDLAPPIKEKIEEIKEELPKIFRFPKKLYKKVINFLCCLENEKNTKITAWAWDYDYLSKEDDEQRYIFYMHYITNGKFKKIGITTSDVKIESVMDFKGA